MPKTKDTARKVLSDADVAKRLGYAVFSQTGKHRNGRQLIKRTRKTEFGEVHEGGMAKKLPAFTTSLDAITAEIEARGLCYRVKVIVRAGATIWGNKELLGNEIDLLPENVQDTAPLALATALLNYLEDRT